MLEGPNETYTTIPKHLLALCNVILLSYIVHFSMPLRLTCQLQEVLLVSLRLHSDTIRCSFSHAIEILQSNAYAPPLGCALAFCSVITMPAWTSESEDVAWTSTRADHRSVRVEQLKRQPRVFQNQLPETPILEQGLQVPPCLRQEKIPDFIVERAVVDHA